MGHISFWPMHIMLIFWEKTQVPYRRTQKLIDASKEVGLEVNSEKTKYMLTSRKKAGQKHSINMANRSMKAWKNLNIGEQYLQIKTACRKELRAD
jgi:hypothetical protein